MPRRFCTILLLILIFPSVVLAAGSYFATAVQKTALSTLGGIIRDTHPSMMGATGTGQLLARNLPGILERLRATRRAIQSTGEYYIDKSPENAEIPYAFIQDSTDRRALVRHLGDLAYLYEELGRAAAAGDERQITSFRNAIIAKGKKISRIVGIWGKNVKEAGVDEGIVRTGNYSISVSAKNATGKGIWLDAGLNVTNGSRLSITATGRWRLGAGARECDANGLPNFSKYRGFLYGTLLGKIGKNGKVFRVGTQYSQVVNSSGKLYLGNNDSNTGDNSGSLQVSIAIE